MHAGQTVEVSVVTTSGVAGFSTEELKEALGLKVRNAAANSALVNMGTVEFEWRCPLVFASEVDVSVRIKVFPADTFDLSRDEKGILLEAVLRVLRGARGEIFPEGCKMKYRLEEVSETLFAEVFGPSSRLP